ncbi:hypothetical protein FACS1894205_3310 [Alphaproteobacteria bacterium]|nr:hypothetical protein FACS1894205_3310 [Alphaproteobacteria bacterium]
MGQGWTDEDYAEWEENEDNPEFINWPNLMTSYMSSGFSEEEAEASLREAGFTPEGDRPEWYDGIYLG